uniref:RNA helicase n=1 Tax=Electrophorus electricus TaxID=8005 RepID=A0A4W4HP61_ELEEL
MNDDQERNTINCFRNRLRRLINVGPVLDMLQFLSDDQKELIRAKTRTEGDISAADLLLHEVITKEHSEGWFRELITALETAGCRHAANYMENNPPSPSKEFENDNCIKLIDLLKLSLVDMKTRDVCNSCYQRSLLTDEDRENIFAVNDQQGNKAGARLLLSRLVKKELGWYSEFLEALKETGHGMLARELQGEPLKGHGETHAQHSQGLEVQSLDSSMDTSDFLSSTDVSAGDLAKGKKASARPSDSEIVLHDYQMEVALPALEGKNIIICLPTGSGKTRVAVYITKQHLESRRRMGQPGKVVVLVNKVPLVEQHYKAEFGKFLKHQYSVERVSGDSQLKISFPQVIEKNDIIICTAQILENSLAKAKNGDEDGIKLSQFTLMVIDECHHTQKGGVYNHIMIRYLKQKHRNIGLLKEQKTPVPLPQILGLTASPGVGGAKNQQKAEEHILRDPFGDVIKGIMDEIHSHAELSPLCQPGTQNYEQWVVQKEQNAAKEDNPRVRVCAEHLRQYNEALHQSNTIRMSDAFSFLNKYYNEELKKKSSPDEDDVIQITDTERFLFRLFKDNKEHLQELTKNPQYENNTLATLKTKILQEFTSRTIARGIIFTKTRHSAIALSQWIRENPKFESVGVRASHLIGGGDQSVVKPMTSAEQKDVLNKFHEGEINVLIATTVAEEGLDIAQCNFVIRYCLVTNEIAMIQARGRGRAEDSSYTVVEEAGSGVAERESVNEYRETMMSKAIARVCTLCQEEYEKKTKEYQMQAIMEERVKVKKKQQKVMKKEDPSKVKFSCRSCNKPVCSGEDIEIIENMHHVNVTTAFRELFTVRENTSLQERFLDYEANGVIACKQCGQQWGSMMLYKSIECPCLHIKHFVVTYGSKKKDFRKWNELAIRFPSFSYLQHAEHIANNSDEEMGDME